MEINTKAPNFKLKDTDSNEIALSTLTKKKGLLIAFTCNHCPYAKAAWPHLIDFSEKYKEITFVAINSNDEKEYPEDSFEKMQEKAKSLPFPYLHDQTQEVAKKYNAVCTPDIFLFKNNEQTKLFYHGRINDNWQNYEKVKEHNLENAIKSLLANENPPTNQPPSMGCSIKWKK